MTDPASGWEPWAPPLDPPDAGGMPQAVAQGMADIYWNIEPHLCAALQWEYYAAMQAPTPSVSSVSTGIQSVAYSPPSPSGSYGAAIGRASWHRSFLTGYIESVPLYSSVMDPTYAPLLRDMSWWIDP
jgi:hypothetical protein